jgi:hypothetical protein
MDPKVLEMKKQLVRVDTIEHGEQIKANLIKV